MELEKLLNKLCDRGRMPRGIYNATIQIVDGEICLDGCLRNWSLRELVSKESGLWQFVCENGMVVRKRQGTNWLGGEPEKCFNYEDYEYWLIESALCDEDKLEQFLLENIMI